MGDAKKGSEAPMRLEFAQDFVLRDQEVTDIGTPRPETRFCLLELPQEELDLLEAGETCRLQAHSSGGAAFCTSKKTYSVEFLENSNSQFLGSIPIGAPAVADSEGAAPAEETRPCSLFAQVRGVMFLKPTQPDTKRLTELVGKHKLDLQGSAEPVPGTSAPPTTAELERCVAASREELEANLASGPFVEHNGAWKLMTPDYEREVLDVALTAIAANGWDWSNVKGQALLEAVQDHFGDTTGADLVPSLNVLRKILRVVMAEEVLKTGGEGALRLDEERVRRFRIEQLLQTPSADVRRRFQLATPPPRPKRSRAVAGGTGAGREVPLSLSELVAASRELCPGEISEVEVLKALDTALRVDDLEDAVHALNVAALPIEARARLRRLFELQTHWRPEQITKLMAPVLPGGTKVDVWMAKTVRTVFVELESGKGETRLFMRKFAGV